MWCGISLRDRIFITLFALMGITLAGGLVMLGYIYQTEKLLASITQKSLPAFKAAEDLETALVNQKGFVSYYFMDNDPEWLRRLAKYRDIFALKLDLAREVAENEDQQAIIAAIKKEYDLYVQKKDRVIDFYRNGRRERGQRIHAEVRDHFARVLALCENYKLLHSNLIVQSVGSRRAEAERLRVLAVGAMATSFLLAIALAFTLAIQVLRPLRAIAAEADRRYRPEAVKNEVQALSRSVRGLIADADKTETALERSRESLLQAEKLALVGKLAAGMAHSIRNPFTSVKMRLFSIGRTLKLTDAQMEDFDVISEEIRHIDTIVQNFLEFSRPPKLRMEPISPSTIIDQTLLLLVHRLKAYDVSVTVKRTQPLPEIDADPEQLKEVFVNLMINACEAMEKGGSIRITEGTGGDGSGRRGVIIRVTDNGPGIAPEIHDKLTQPFFTTKDNGTGLGLNIAKRIVEEHRGTIRVDSEPGRGATFIVTLPCKENSDESNSACR
jgi:signal transduction histidine kinase